MSENQSVSRQDVEQALGFDPFTQDDAVYACAMIESGKRAGYWCVFTNATRVNPALAAHPNFADAGWGVFGDTPSASGIVYTFSPASPGQQQRLAG